MKAVDIFKQEPYRSLRSIAVSFPPNTVLVTGAEEVTSGFLIHFEQGKISLEYTHPHYSVGGVAQEMCQEVGSEWVKDTEYFEVVV